MSAARATPPGESMLDCLIAIGAYPRCGALAGLWHMQGCQLDGAPPSEVQRCIEEAII